MSEQTARSLGRTGQYPKVRGVADPIAPPPEPMHFPDGKRPPANRAERRSLGMRRRETPIKAATA